MKNFLLIFFCIFFWPGQLWASECKSIEIKDALKAADFVFIGKAGKIIDPRDIELSDGRKVKMYRVKFAVSKIYKGPRMRKIILKQKDELFFKQMFERNQKYLVYAKKQDDKTITAEMCGGTKPLVKAKKDILTFNSLQTNKNEKKFKKR